MKKKVILLMACFITLLVVLVACGENNATDGTDSGTTASTDVMGTGGSGGETTNALGISGFPLAESIDVHVMGRFIETPWEDMPFWRVLSEETNINWTFNTPPSSDFVEVLNLTLVSQDFPDVFFGSALTAGQQIELGEDGVLLPLQDLIREHAPNIQRLLDENPHIVNSITAPDGNIYALPTFNQSFDAIWPVGPVYYNGTWLQYLDAEVPRTLADFEDLMFRFRDEMPEILGVDRVFPISATDSMVWLRAWMLSFWGMTTRGVQATDGVVVHNVTTDAYRAYLEWMNMAFEERLLHPEIFTLTGDQQSALGNDNLIGFYQAWHSHHLLGTDEAQALDNPFIRPVTSEWSPEGILPRSPGFSFGQFAITYRAADPVAILRVFDYFYSPEGAIFADHGPEGYFWEYDTHAETGEQIRVRVHDIDTSRGRFTPFYGFPAPNLIPNRMPRLYIDRYEETDETFQNFLRAETEATIGTYGRVAFPPAMLTFEEANRISIINADLNLEIDRLEAEFITGVRPINDETWAAFQSDLVRIGIGELVEVFQDAHNRWLANAE